MTVTLTQWIILVTAVIVLATKILELVSSAKKSKAAVATPTAASTSSTTNKWRPIVSDVLILLGWVFALFHFSFSSQPVSTIDLGLLLVLIPAMFVFFRR